MTRTCFIVVGLIAAMSRPALGSSPQSIADQAYVEQRTGAQVPKDLTFNDEHGNAVHLGDYFGKRPSILLLVYFSCPNLCPTTLRHLTEGLNGTALKAGRDFDVIVASFDQRDTPADAQRQKAACIAAYNHRGGAGWHFLTGAQPAIDQLTQAVGFHCTFDPQRGQFAHAVAIMVLTPEGTISHDFFGIDVSPADLESSLHDAQSRQITRVDQPDQQYCFAYDPSTSAQGRRITHALQVLGVVWIAMIGGYISMKLTRELRAREGSR